MRLWLLLPGRKEEREGSWAVDSAWVDLVKRLTDEGVHVLQLCVVGDDPVDTGIALQKNLNLNRLGFYAGKAEGVICGTELLYTANSLTNSLRIPVISLEQGMAALTPEQVIGYVRSGVAPVATSAAKTVKPGIKLSTFNIQVPEMIALIRNEKLYGVFPSLKDNDKVYRDCAFVLDSLYSQTEGKGCKGCSRRRKNGQIKTLENRIAMSVLKAIRTSTPEDKQKLLTAVCETYNKRVDVLTCYALGEIYRGTAN